MGKSKVEKVHVESQATPLANDVLDMIRKQITGGTFGTGFGPLQQQAGTAIQQFVNSGGGSFDTSKEFEALEKIQNRRLNEQSAQLRESFAGLGGRFSQNAANAEGKFRAESNENFTAGLGEILRNAFESQQNRLLQGIGALQTMGLQNIAPAFSFAEQGILPDQVVVHPSTLQQITGALAGGASFLAGLKNNPFGGNNGGFDVSKLPQIPNVNPVPQPGDIRHDF